VATIYKNFLRIIWPNHVHFKQ